jgi:hypothetical protein
MKERLKMALRPDDEGIKQLWNVGKLLPDYTVQHLKDSYLLFHSLSFYSYLEVQKTEEDYRKKKIKKEKGK